MSSPPKIRLNQGATLVEVMVAVAILAMTMVPLLAMLSMAIDTSGQAVGLTLSARISEQLMGEVQQADWATLNSWSGQDYYYDDQGLKLTGASASNQGVYAARVTISTTGVLMAASNSGSQPNAWDRQVITLVASAPGPRAKALLDSASSAIASKKPLPKGVYLNRALLTNLEKAPAS